MSEEISGHAIATDSSLLLCQLTRLLLLILPAITVFVLPLLLFLFLPWLPFLPLVSTYSYFASASDLSTLFISHGFRI